MSSLVLRLQNEALDPDVPLVRLLAQAKVIAAKLKLTKTSDWVSAELAGYGDPEQVPDYRYIYGGFVYHHPMYGWQRIQISNVEMAQLFEKRPVKIPVSQLEALVAIAERGKHDVMISISAGLANELRESLGGISYDIQYSANSSQLVGILEAVRQRVLDWTLQLETDGILGDDLAFSEEEKTRASRGDTYNINVETMIGAIGAVSDHATVSAVHATQSMDLAAVQSFLRNFRHGIEDTEFEERPEVERSLGKIDEEAASGKPRKNIVVKHIMAIKTALAAAAGFVGKDAAEHLLDHFLDGIMS